MAPKKNITSSKKKDKYRTRNWKEYNRALVNRGSITFWFSDDAIANWYSVGRTGKPGRPDIYSDSAIQCGLMIKVVFHAALRALQGFVRSLIEGLRLDIVCPHYSVFSRRAKDLRIPLRKLLKPGEKLNVVLTRQELKFLARVSGRLGNMAIPSAEPGVRFTLGCAQTPGKS